jgi:RNase P subunit RPR2
MSPFTYRCPQTGFRVQSYTRTKTSDGDYEVVMCVICGWVHLVNPASERVRGENKEKPARVLRPTAL